MNKMHCMKFSIKNIKKINGGHVSKVLVVEWKRQNGPLERFRDQ